MQLRVLGLNVFNVEGDHVDRVGDFLEASGAEVLALTECGATAFGRLAERLGCAGAAHAPAPYWGNGILTRTLPLEELAIVTLEPRHTWEKRSAAIVAIEAGASELCCTVTHLDHTSEEERLQQIDQLLEHSGDALRRGLLIGDLNSLRREDLDDEGWARVSRRREAAGVGRPRFEVIDRLLGVEGFEDAAGAAGDPRPTCPHGVRVDYLLRGPACPARFVSGSYDVLPVMEEEVIDHRAVVVTIELE
jgi:endonuclease/exonuclease/phosphatase family metal-dependent hydrolase